MRRREYPQAAGWQSADGARRRAWKLIPRRERAVRHRGRSAGVDATSRLNRPNIVDGDAGAPRGARPRASSRARAATVSAEAAARLRALGYVGGGVAGGGRPPTAPNPAEESPSWTQFEKALSLMDASRDRCRCGAEDARSLVAASPRARCFRSSYARALQDGGRSAEASNVLRAAVERWPADATLFHDLASRRAPPATQTRR